MLDYLAGMLIAALAGMGVGGGGLLVLYLVFVKDMSQLEAQWINMVFFIFASTSALLWHRKKRNINWKLSLLLIALGITGAFLGAITANIISPKITRKIFGWLMVISGSITLFPKKIKNIFKKGLTKKK